MIEALAALVAAAALAVAILDQPSMRRSIAMAVAGIMVPVLIAGDQWHSARSPNFETHRRCWSRPALRPGRGRPDRPGGRSLAGHAPGAGPGRAAFRIPLNVGGEDANLLVPLYLVMGGGVLASLIRARRNDLLPALPTVAPAGLARWLKPLLAAAVVLYALGLFYTDDRSTGLQNLCFFLIPFGVIFALMAEVEWTRDRLRILLGVVVGTAWSAPRSASWNTRPGPALEPGRDPIE